MRKLDKSKNILKVNLLFEQRHNESKGLLKEQSNDTYFETLSEVLEFIEKKALSIGFEIDEESIWTNFGTGGISYGTTKSANIPLLKNGEPILDKRGKDANRAFRVSIYRMDSGKYELTLYKTW
jgi:hypothetical protein